MGYQSKPRTQTWLAPLYTDLHSPPGCMISVHALCGHPSSALDAKASRPASRCAQSQIRWVRVADASAEHTRLSRMIKHSVEGLLQCFHLDLEAAADACAEGSIVDIGDGSSPATRFVVCGTWQFQEVQEQWRCLTKEAQRYIACFEPWLN